MSGYDTSIQYQAFELTETLAYALCSGFLLTLSLLWVRMGQYKYGCGKKPPKNSLRPSYGAEHYWLRWVHFPWWWIPTWAFGLLLLVVWGLWGAGWGLIAWIVNDFAGVAVSSMFWLTIICFMLIVPALAGVWAVMFFGCNYLGWSLIFSVLIVLASGVQFGMTIAYAIIYPNGTSSNFTYQWIAFAFAIPQLLFYIYVLALNIVVYLLNKDRDMDGDLEVDLAADETVEERALVRAHIAQLDDIAVSSVVASDEKLASYTRSITSRRMGTRRVGSRTTSASLA
jgi:MFS family permease